MGPRKYKRRRGARVRETLTSSRKIVEEEIATFEFRKSVPTTVAFEEFTIPAEFVKAGRGAKQPRSNMLPDNNFKAPQLDDIIIKSESFPLLDDGQPLCQPKVEEGAEPLADFFGNVIIEKFDPDVINDLKEILQSPVKERNDGRPRRSVKPTLKVMESQELERETGNRKSAGRNVENRCQICGIVFSNRNNLISHVQVHI